MAIKRPKPEEGMHLPILEYRSPRINTRLKRLKRKMPQRITAKALNCGTSRIFDSFDNQNNRKYAYRVIQF